MNFSYQINGIGNTLEIPEFDSVTPITVFNNIVAVVITQVVNDNLNVQISGIDENGEIDYQGQNIAIKNLPNSNVRYNHIEKTANDIEIIPTQFEEDENDVFYLIDQHTIHSCAILQKIML